MCGGDGCGCGCGQHSGLATGKMYMRLMNEVGRGDETRRRQRNAFSWQWDFSRILLYAALVLAPFTDKGVPSTRPAYRVGHCEVHYINPWLLTRVILFQLKGMDFPCR